MSNGADSRSQLRNYIGRDLLHAMFLLRVFSRVFHHFFLGGTMHDEITIDSYIPTAHFLCHPGTPLLNMKRNSGLPYWYSIAHADNSCTAALLRLESHARNRSRFVTIRLVGP